MGLAEFSVAELVLWAVAVMVTVTLFSGIMVRRRTLYAETLRDYVQRSQAKPLSDSSDAQNET
ncbi:hypothetical protein UC8_58340 [Roseimaritima ulvae]|uniref:CcmD family protein n=1 Tax=Roseimaritima ulvae TaxID=980254 RepID=A0A5B9R0K3_9BACT|nr:hypothetical protein UC8_58340 [Roseimaritima ulvae]